MLISQFSPQAHHSLKRNHLRFEDLQEFIELYQSGARHKRQKTFHPETNPEGRWRKYTFEKLVARD